MGSKSDEGRPARPDWIDVSIPLRDGMIHWPGDPRVTIERAADMDRGDGLTVSTLGMGAHTGTHMDAPLHYLLGGKGIDEIPFDAMIGPARVIAIEDPSSIRPEEIRRHRIRRGERILFKTENSKRDWPNAPFDEEYVAVSPAGARFLAQRGVRLVGVDYLSVGDYNHDGPETHRVLLEGGVWIIEGLDLSQARPGRYEMICLPLRISGGDGAPARVLLRPIQGRRRDRAS